MSKSYYNLIILLTKRVNINNILTEKECNYRVYAIVKGLPRTVIRCNKHELNQLILKV